MENAATQFRGAAAGRANAYRVIIKGSGFAAASCRLIKCIRLPSGHETITANAANMPLPAGYASATPANLTVRAKICSE